ncbi:MAG: hypothetical protein H6658_19065 [Ardenticatenaceae bacterium]|nr:hypothetical protein [Ardenticatenaceae bacterium]
MPWPTFAGRPGPEDCLWFFNKCDCCSRDATVPANPAGRGLNNDSLGGAAVIYTAVSSFLLVGKRPLTLT